MTGTRIELQPAWLLSQKPYRETSELLEVLSRDHGRVGLVVRGTRGAKARQRGVVTMFRLLLISWLERGDLGTVTAVETGGASIALQGERIFHGWYLNELLLKLLQRHDPHSGIFEDYSAALARLAAAPLEAEAGLRIFEKRLLEQLGYGLPLDALTDVEGAFTYAPQRGFEPIGGQGDARIENRASRGLTTYPATSLIALRNETLSTRLELDDARRVLRTALEPLVPRASLRTPQLLRDMRRLQATAPDRVQGENGS